MDERFTATARLISQGDPPQWLTEQLARFAPFVGSCDKPGADRGIEQALKAIACIEKEVLLYAEIGERFDFIDIPDCVDATAQALHEFREFLEGELRPVRKGGPTPDGRRKICGGVCLSAWRELHGEAQPYSKKLHEACEKYWQACGQEPTSNVGSIKNWERVLLSISRTI